MRFPLAALFFLIGSFIFFCFAGFSYFLITNIDDALSPLGAAYDSTYQNIVTILPTAFGIIAALFFVAGILLIFILDSLQDEPEYYYRQ